MKKMLFILLVLGFTTANAQFKDDAKNSPSIRNSVVKTEISSFFLGFINPNNFTMRHSFSMSYSAIGSGGIALGVYTNSLSYKFNDQLNLEVDASIVNSPYNSFGNGFANDINGVYLSRARLNYRPSETTNIVIEYRQVPYNYNYSGYSRYPYYSGFGYFD